MPGSKKINSDLDIQGKIILTDVPNSTGAIVTYNSSSKTLSQRTNAQIISDLGLITAANIAASYYTKTQLQTSGQSQVHWNNITNKPASIDTLDDVVTKSGAQNITGIKNFQNGFDINTHKFVSIDASNILIAGGKNVFGSGTNNILDSAIAMGNNIFPSMNLQVPNPQVPSYNKGYLGIGTDIFINYTGGTNYRPDHNAHDSWIGYGRALGAGFLDGTNVTMIGTTNMHKNDVKYADCVTVIGKGFSNGIKTRSNKTLDPNRVVTASNGYNVHGVMSDVIGIGHENWIEDISHSVVVGANLRPYSYVFNSLILGNNHVNVNYEGTQAQADMYLDYDVIIGMGVQKRTSRHAANNNLLIGMDGFYTMGSAPNPDYRPLVEGTFKNAKFQVNGVVVAGHEKPGSDRPNETNVPLVALGLPLGVTFNPADNTFTFDGSQLFTEFKIGEFIANPDVSVYVEIGTIRHSTGTWGSTIDNVVDSGNTAAENWVAKRSFIVYNNSDLKLSSNNNFEGVIYVKYIKTDLNGTGVLANYQTKDSYENLTSEIRGGTIDNGHLSFGLNAGKFLHLGSKTTIFGNNAYAKGVTSTSSVIIGNDAVTNNPQSLFDVIIGAGAGANTKLGTGSVTLVGANSLKNPLERIISTTTLGRDTLLNLQYGSHNTAVGATAGAFLLNGQSNVFFGRNAGLIKNGSSNIFIGESAGGYGLLESTVNNTIVIGAGVVPEVPNNTTTIGGAANTDNFLYGTTHSNAFKVRGGLATQVMMANGTLKDESAFGSGTIPLATSTVVGGRKLFSDTVQTVAASAVTSTASRTYGVQVNAAGQMVVNVPWTNTVYSHPNSGVTAGTYRSVTVNAQGHVTAGTNPTTIAGYGITDAYTKTESNTNFINKTNTNLVNTATWELKAYDGYFKFDYDYPTMGWGASTLVIDDEAFANFNDLAIRQYGSTLQNSFEGSIYAAGSITSSTGFVKVGGTSTQVLMADGSVKEQSTFGGGAGNYVTLDTTQTITGPKIFTGVTNFNHSVGFFGTMYFQEDNYGGEVGLVDSNEIALVVKSGVYYNLFGQSAGTATYDGLTRDSTNWNYGLDADPSPSYKLSVGGNVKATAFVKNGGTATQVLMADGSVKEQSTFGGGSTNFLQSNPQLTYGASGLNYFNAANIAGNNPAINQAPTAAWHHIIRMNHANSAGYYADLAISMVDNSGISRRVISNGTALSDWVKMWDSSHFTQSNINNWNTAFGWGNHATAGYLTSSALSPYAQTSWVNANFDKYTAWNLQTNNVQRTSMPSGSNLNLVAGANVTINYSAGGTVTISAANSAPANMVTTDTTQTISGAKTFTQSITAPAFYESSLKSLKKNIKPFEKSGLELIGDLKIVTFDRKDESAKNKIGIIADDSPKEFLSEELDAVDLYKTVFIQAKAIQELKSEVDELKELVKQLLNNK